MTFAEINIGDGYEKKRKITESMVNTFAEITEDKNPLHLDEKFAKNSRFGQRIAHGALVAGQISAIIGMDFPGPGSVYMKQDSKFLKPVFINEEVLVKVTVKEKIAEKFRLIFSTQVFKENGELAIDGEAMVYYNN